MMLEFNKGDVLKAEDLQEIVNAVSRVEAALPEVVAPGRRVVGSRAPLAFFNVTAAESDVVAAPSVGSGTLNAGGLVCSVSYGGTIPGKIGRGHAVLPLPAVADYDGVYPMTGAHGQIPIPAYAKAVRDVDGNTWLLSDLVTGGGFAATVAKCTLPDGTELRLTLYTERGGNKLCFGLECGGTYGGS